MLAKTKIAVIGAGKLGEALIAGMMDAGVVKKDQFIATAAHRERIDLLQKKLGIKTTLSNGEAVRKARIVLLCVKPQVVEEAQVKPTDRLHIISGDFFHDPLPEADAYILMEVIHDWDDDASGKILAAVRRAARPNAKLLLIEALLPNDPSPNWPTTLDIVMLTIGGRQRTLREYSDLIRDSGFVTTRDVDTQSGISIIEAIAV